MVIVFDGCTKKENDFLSKIFCESLKKVGRRFGVSQVVEFKMIFEAGYRAGLKKGVEQIEGPDKRKLLE